MCNEEKIYEGEISQLQVETENGIATILPGHQPYMTKISKKVSYKPLNSNMNSIDISVGFIYTDGTNCFAVVDK